MENKRSVDQSMVRTFIKISAAIISLSLGSNLLRNIGMLNFIGWSLIIAAVILPIILKKKKTQIALTLMILTLSHGTNTLRNAGILDGYNDSNNSEGTNNIFGSTGLSPVGWGLVALIIVITAIAFIVSSESKEEIRKG